MTDQKPEVGVALFVIDDSGPKPKLLLGLRKGPHAPGQWGNPGGKLAFGEGFAECALRELVEEVGDDFAVTYPQYWTTVNTVYPDEPRHFVVICMVAFWQSGQPVVAEPDKCECWRWFDWDDLPSPLMQGIARLYLATGFDETNEDLAKPQWDADQQRILGDPEWPPLPTIGWFVDETDEEDTQEAA